MKKSMFLAMCLVPFLATAPAFAKGKSNAFRFAAELSGAQEVPDSGSGGRGDAEARFSRDLSQVSVRVEVKDLDGTIAAAHLHCQIPGQNGPVILNLFPTTGVSEGRIVKDVFASDDLEDVIDADCNATCGFPINNIASLHHAAGQGCIYVNVHSDVDPGGELRGQLISRHRDD